MFAKYPIAEVASLMAAPARVAILTALLDGRLRPAGELARVADLSPQAASAHLAKLTQGRMLTLVRQGRHHYYKIARPEVGLALEALAVVNPPPKPSQIKETAEVQALRFARTCYDHLAGRLAVLLVDALVQKNLLRMKAKEYQLTSTGNTFLYSIGIDVTALEEQRRCFARPCLDWTERRYHLAGSLGAVFLSFFFDLEWLKRCRGTRAVRLTDLGRREIGRRFHLLVP